MFNCITSSDFSSRSKKESSFADSLNGSLSRSVRSSISSVNCREAERCRPLVPMILVCLQPPLCSTGDFSTWAALRPLNVLRISASVSQIYCLQDLSHHSRWTRCVRSVAAKEPDMSLLKAQLRIGSSAIPSFILLYMMLFVLTLNHNAFLWTKSNLW